MNPILYMVSLFYHWFNRRESSKDVAYEISLIAVTILFFCNLLTGFIVINIVTANDFLRIDTLLKKMIGLKEEQQYLIVAAFLIICSLINALFATRKKVKSINYNIRDEVIDFVLLFVYIIGSILAFVIAVNNKA